MAIIHRGSYAHKKKVDATADFETKQSCHRQTNPFAARKRCHTKIVEPVMVRPQQDCTKMKNGTNTATF